MAQSSSRKNLVILMSLAGATVLAFHRWVLPRLVDLRPISDGEHAWSADDRRLRTAVWADAEELGGELETAEREAQLAFSPDGRWAAFVAGEVGANSELFLAEVGPGGLLAPRALAELGSGADEIAPAFAPDALYFASNRGGGAGGFDLYRAPWDGGAFGEATLVDGGVNSEADELDPAPLAGALVFASNRQRGEGRDFELYVAKERAADGARLVEHLPALGSPRDEREPFVAFDERALYFASDRAADAGGFDLYRSFRELGAWLPPQPLAGLDDGRAERSPRTSADGFTLHFEREGDANAELFRARTIELFRGAEPARGWADLVLLAALLLLALVAALSKRWEELDLLYKCLLASVLLHALVIFATRYLAPDTDAGELAPKPSRTFRIQLDSQRQRERSLVERDGRIEAGRSRIAETAEPERVETARAPEEAGDAPGPLAELARANEPELAAPERAEVELAPAEAASEHASVVLAAPAETRERIALDSSEPELAAPRTERPARTAPEASGPVATSAQRPARVDDAPSALAMARRSGSGDDVAPPVPPSGTAPERSAASTASDPSVAMPAESRARLASSPEPAAQPSARSFDAARTSESAAPNPARASIAREDASRGREEASAPAPSTLARRASSEDAPAERHEVASAAPAGRRSSQPDIALPREEVRALAGSAEPPAEAAPAPVAIETERRAKLDAGPGERWTSPNPREASTAKVAEAAPAAQPLAAPERERDDVPPPAPRRLDDTPYRSRFGAEKEVALREHGGTVETERAVAQGLRYLAARQRRDGSWGSASDRHEKYRDVRVGKSALALLAFLGAGHTGASATEHSGSVERAIGWLLATQDSSTGHFGDSEAYGHGIATYALAECFAITRDPRLRPAIELAVQQILRQQLTRGGELRAGGWSYFYPDGAIFDEWPRTSITAWQVMALESARLGGLQVPDRAFDASREFLANAWDDEMKRFRYNHSPERLNQTYRTLPGSTPAALFALSLLGEDLAGARWSDAVQFVASCAPDGYRWDGELAFVERAQGNLYFWYYGSLAMLRRGGVPWERWNAALKDALPPAQQPDGSWIPIDVYCEYAGDDDRDRIYSTAMCVLSLEVYYRYFTPLLKVK